jgi:phosphoribosylformylglycinamidine synthase PurS subunit
VGSPAEAEKRVDAMCKKLLANTVIEEYRFEITE